MNLLSKLSLMLAAGALSAAVGAQTAAPKAADSLEAIAAQAPAAPAAPVVRPTLPQPLVDAIRKAVLTNPEVQAKWNGFLAADSQRDIAKAGFLPQVDLSASVGVENRVTSALNYGTYNLNSAQVTLNQILFDGLFTVNEVSRLNAAKLTRYYELLEASETAALEAIRAYADVGRYRELVELATANYVEHKQATILVEERANAGVGRRVDVEQANGRLSLSESNLLTELTNLHDVSARYLRVVGEKPAANLPPLPEPFRIGALPPSIEVLMRDGLSNSPTLLAAVQNTRANRIAVDTAKSSFMPRVDLQVYGSRGYNSGGTVGDSRATGAAIALTYNIFKGGADNARRKQTVSLAEQARDLQEKACRDVRQSLSLAYSDSKSLNEQLRYIDAHRLATEKTREAYRQQFDIGQRTLLDLLDTQNEFFEASRSYINSRHDQANAQARTLAAMGQLVAAMGVKRPDGPTPQEAGLDGAAIDPKEICPLEEVVVDSLEKIKADIVLPTRAKPAAQQAAAATKDCGRIILLPEDNGKVGTMEIKSNKSGEVKLDQPYAAALDDCDKVVLGKAEDLKRFPIAALPGPARYYRINFELGKTVMLPESETIIKSLMEDYEKTGAPEVMIIGHADKTGTPAGNLALSKRRAEVVRQMLNSKGVKGKIDSAWRGDKDPLPGTEKLRVEPKNRRVEVKIQ